MVATNIEYNVNNKTVGKLEKSRGLKAFIATIKIRSESKILLVKKISNNTAGNGRTIIATSINMPNGNPIFFKTGPM